jgi:hypothetical protein
MKQDQREIMEVANVEAEALIAVLDDLELVLVGGGSGEVVLA